MRGIDLDKWLDHVSDDIAAWQEKTGKSFMSEIFPNRGKMEKWLDKHNHKMELLRTLTSFFAAIFSAMVFLKVFGGI